MNIRTRRPAFTVIERSQTWLIRDGVQYRKCVVRTAAGDLRWYGIRDDILDAMDADA